MKNSTVARQITDTNEDMYYEHYVYSYDGSGGDYDSTNLMGGYYTPDYEFVITGLPDVDLDAFGFWSVLPHYYADNAHWQTNYSDGSGYSATVTTARTALMLHTGGRAIEHRLSLIQLQCSGLKYGAPSGWPWLGMETTVIPPSTMKVLGQSPGGDGNLWVMEPDNAGVELNLTAPGVQHYGAWATPTKYKLVHQVFNQALTDKHWNRQNLGVGEQVYLGFYPDLDNVQWTALDGGIESYGVGFTYNGTYIEGAKYTAPSNAVAGHAYTLVGATVHGQLLSVPFWIYEPSGVDHAVITATNGVSGAPNYTPGQAGAEMQLNVYIAPTYVSFYNVQILEVGEDATSVTGYFTNNPPFTTFLLHHTPADWFGLNPDNSWSGGGDHCWSPGPLASPWSSGSFTWVVPAKWSLSPSTVTNSMTGWNQVFTIDSSGTVTISKFNKLVSRTISNVITNN